MGEYTKLCNIIAARRCRNAGQSVKEICQECWSYTKYGVSLAENVCIGDDK